MEAALRLIANLKIENTFGETEKDGLKDITTQGGRNGQQSLSQQNSIFGGLKLLICKLNSV